MKQTNISKLRSQATKALKWQLALGESRHENKRIDNSTSGIFSVRTWNENVCALARIGDELGIRRLREIDQSVAIDYLIERLRLSLSAKAIGRDRVALERFLGRKLPSYQNLQQISEQPALKWTWLKRSSNFLIQHPSDRRTPIGSRTSVLTPRKAGIGVKATVGTRATNLPLREISRAYSDDQLKNIANALTMERDRLAVLLMRDAGLRVHELYSLRRLDEGKPRSNQRDWRSDLHLLREDAPKYLVTGKGGLTRVVTISPALAQRLENLRNDKPVKVKDRGVVYRQRYNLLAGNALSKRFSDISKDLLGYSLGAHGARHSFGQARMNQLVSTGVPFKTALHIVSQEMGHMRPQITKVYLR